MREVAHSNGNKLQKRWYIEYQKGGFHRKYTMYYSYSRMALYNHLDTQPWDGSYNNMAPEIGKNGFSKTPPAFQYTINKNVQIGGSTLISQKLDFNWLLRHEITTI